MKQLKMPQYMGTVYTCSSQLVQQFGMRAMQGEYSTHVYCEGGTDMRVHPYF